MAEDSNRKARVAPEEVRAPESPPFGILPTVPREPGGRDALGGQSTHAAVLVCKEGDRANEWFPLDQPRTVLGRDPADSDLVLRCQNVSRAHAILEQTESGVTIRDLDSTNGTLLNGERLIGQTRLRPGDRIEVGSFVLLFATADKVDQAWLDALLAADRCTRMPHPIAAARLALDAAEPELVLTARIAYVETMFHYLGVLSLADLVATEKDDILLGRRVSEALSRPLATGSWAAVARTVEQLIGRERTFMPELHAALADDPPGSERLDQLGEGFAFPRNQTVHRGFDSRDALRRAAESIEQRLDFLDRYDTFKVVGVDVETDGFAYMIHSLMGANPPKPLTDLRSKLPLSKGAVLVRSPTGGTLLRLDPFVVFEPCASCPGPEEFLIDSVKAGAVRYQSRRTPHVLRKDQVRDTRDGWHAVAWGRLLRALGG